MRPMVSGLVLCAVLLPTILYGLVAWQDRIAVLKHAARNVQSTAKIFEEHAANVFETHKLIASLVNEHIRGMSWPEIAGSREVHDYLANMIGDQPRIQSLWLIDAEGLVRNSSAVFPAPRVSVADRDYFTGLRERNTGTFIGQVVHGRVFAEDIFNVAQRRASDTAVFDGVVVVSALPSYFTNFWTTVANEPGVSTLIRQDGAILSRQPPVDPNLALNAVRPLVQRIEQSPDGFYRGISTINGVERLYAYDKIPGFPVYAVRGIDLKAALQTWYDHLLIYGGFFAIGTVALVSLALVAVLRLRQWRDTALVLREEMEHRERIETQLRQAQKMEALGQLTGGIAHDFGNILQVITNSLDLLEYRRGNEKWIALAKDATDRGAKAVKSMLAFARRQVLRPEDFDLNAALTGMDSLLRQATGSTTELCMLLSTAPCWITADRNQMELALLNIAINARDAMPSGGTLTVTTKAVHLTGDPDGLVGDYVAVAISDTGTGMPLDVRIRALEPFFTTKEPGKGTGLGLSMVYGFSKQARGTVTIESEIGRGTSVVVYLPRSQSGKPLG